MALTKCPACGNAVSTEAASCPKCGHGLKRPGSLSRQSPVVIIGSVILVLFVVWVVMNMRLF